MMMPPFLKPLQSFGILLVFLPTLAYAKKKAAMTKKEIAAETENAPPSEHSTDLGESAQARSTKVAGGAVDAGYAFGGISGFGLRGFYNRFHNWQLGLQYLSAKQDLASQVSETQGTKIDNATLAISLISLHARYFFGNSFNMYVGLGQRTITYDLKVSVAGDPSTYIRGTGISISNVLGFGLGNQWAWNNGFFIGGDWLGYYFSIGSKNSYDSEITNSATNDQQKVANNMRDLSEKLGKTGHYQMTGHVGWMF